MMKSYVVSHNLYNRIFDKQLTLMNTHSVGDANASEVHWPAAKNAIPDRVSGKSAQDSLVNSN